MSEEKKYDFGRKLPDHIWQKMDKDEQDKAVMLGLVGCLMDGDGNWYRQAGFNTYAREQDYIDEMIEKYK